MDRRTFVKSSAIITARVALSKVDVISNFQKSKNILPEWRGFNITDFNSPNPKAPILTSEDHFKWMQDWGFDFIRLPISYPYYLNFDRSKNIAPEEVYHIDENQIEKIEKLVFNAHKYKLHVSINLHRAPGYCINAGFNEPYNLWRDEPAQNAFYFHWNYWAKRFKEINPSKISFDLLNEPGMREDMNDQHSAVSAIPGPLYRKVALNAANAIQKENASFIVIADGNNVGNSVISEIEDLKISQSCRGYYPHSISHFKAPWANKDVDHMPEPKWPGQVGNQYLSREMLENYYKPWIQLVNKGVGVHCGECGCWNKTPHKVFLSWFSDVTDILSQHKIGYAAWNFIGDFGVLDSGRQDVDYENWYGHKLDRKFLDLMKKRNS